MSISRITSKSPLAVAREALSIGQDALPAYSAPKSKHSFTQPQLFAILVLRQFFRTDYRGIVALLQDFSDLRTALQLEHVPHFTTIQKAELRFEKKMLLGPC